MRGSDRIVVIKLGGSVITEKKHAFTANPASINRIARELAKRKEHLILLNGAGSFGHIPVKRYGLDQGYKVRKKAAFARTKLQLLRLQEIIVSILCDHGVPVVPFASSSFMLARSGRLCKVELAPVRRFLDLGLVPLFGGDLVPDLEQGWRVVSADQMASWIAPRIGAAMIIYGTDVDGLYASDPKASEDARLIESLHYDEVGRVARFVLGSGKPDVTAGMRGKLLEAQKAARKGVKVAIMNLNRPQDLHAILDGRHGRWTTIFPRRKLE